MHALVSAIVALEPALPDATETAMAEPNATDGRHALCSGAHLLHYACEDDPNVAVQERNAIRRIQERRAWLGCHGHAPGAPKIKSAIQLRTGAEMWALVTPYYPCMWSLEKQPSFAQSTDGGKWTCGLREIGRRRGCVVYSFGSKNEYQFEHAVREQSACEIHIFDPTSDPPNAMNAAKLNQSEGFRGKYRFHSIGLGIVDGKANFRGSTFPVRTLESVMRALGHWEGGVDILKVDVEGAEFSMVRQTDWRRLRIGQLLMEVHPGETMEASSKALEALPRNSFGSYLDAAGRERSRQNLGMCPDCAFRAMQLDLFLLTLERSGLRLVTTEPVSAVASKVEMALVNPAWHPHLGFRACNATTTAV